MASKHSSSGNLKVNSQPDWNLLMQIRISWNQHVLMILHIVGHSGRGGVGQLGQGVSGPAVHGDRGVVILHLPGNMIQIINTKLRTFNLLPASRKTLCFQGM